MNFISRAIKAVAWGIIVVLLLLSLLTVGIQFPTVQNRALQLAVPTLERALGGAKVSLGAIDIDFFDAVRLQEIYVEDQQQDTLLYAESLTIDIGAFSLFAGNFFVDEVVLEGALLNVYREAEDSVFNHQFVLDAFAPRDTTTRDTTASAFTFGISELDLKRTRLRYRDAMASVVAAVDLSRLYTKVETLDLESLALSLEAVTVSGLTGSYQVAEKTQAPENLQGSEPQLNAPITFPYAGFPIQVHALSLDDLNFSYQDTNAPKASGLDPGHVEVSNLSARAKDFSWDSTALQLHWQALEFQERSGLAVAEVAFEAVWTPTELRLKEVALRTDASRVLAKAELDYPDIGALLRADPDLRLRLALEESYVAFSDLKLLAPLLVQTGINLHATRNLYLQGRMQGTLGSLVFDDFRARVGQTTALALSGRLNNVLDANRLSYDLRVNRFTTSYADLTRLTTDLPLPEGLARFGRVQLQGKLSGSTSSFRGQDLELRTDGRTAFRGDLALTNLGRPEALQIEADVEALRTRGDELLEVLPDSLGIDVAALGDIDFAGTFAGTLTTFAVDATLATEQGNVTADLSADLTSDYSDGTYQGVLALDSFQVGALLQDSTLGALSLQADLDGKGLTRETLSSRLKTSIKSFTYLGYRYRDIAVDGFLDQQKFRGQAAIDDPNLQLVFDGLLNFQDSIPVLVFEASLDTARLHQLNLYPTPLNVSLDLSADLSGNALNNLDGRVLLDSIWLADTVRVAGVDSMLLRASDTLGGRYLSLTSDLVNAHVQGVYKLDDLPVLLRNYVNDFFPVDAYLSSAEAGRPALALNPEPQATKRLTDQSFDFSVAVSNPVPVVALFDPALTKLDTAFLGGRFDSREKSLVGQLAVPEFQYAGTQGDSLRLDLGGDVASTRLALRARGLMVAGQVLDLAQAELRLGDDSLNLRLDGFATPDSLLLGTRLGVVLNDAGRYLVRMTEDLEIAGQTWTVDPTHAVEYWKTYLQVANLTFAKDDQRIGFSSEDASADEDVAPITVSLDNVDLQQLERFVDLEGFSLAGRINGLAGIRDPISELYYVADVTVDDIVLNEEPVGTLIVKATSEDLAGVVAIDVRLDGPVNDVAIAGEYEVISGGLDVDVRVQAFELRILDPMATGVIANSQGLLRAELTVTGSSKAPAVAGFVSLDGAQTDVLLLGTQYRIDDSRITFTERKMDVGELVVLDSMGRRAVLSGAVTHNYFRDVELALNFRTAAFRVLNLAPSLQELYFGEAIITADINILGDLEEPRVKGRAGTLTGTDVSIVPLISANSVSDERWVIYADPATIEQDTAQVLRDVYQANTLGLDLSMVFNVDDDAIIRVIIDPATGDALFARGNCNLNLQMSPDGEISVTGRYAISEGSYQFTFSQGGLALVQRNFAIQPGSFMQLVGDPLASRFDITAVYELKTTTAELLPEGTSKTQAESARRRQLVRVLLGVKGTLEEPLITMDVEVPESGGNVLSNDVQSILANLTEQQMYQQVFSLLVLGGFSTIGGSGPGGNGFDPGATAGVAVINSVNGLISNQLNKLADNLVGNAFDLSVGLESYADRYDENNLATTANVDVSRSLFNDRLTITLGTDINVEQTQTTANTAGFQSNFILSYQLTKSGRYRIKVFRRPDYDIISTGTDYENGIGVSYERSFD